MRAVPPSYCLLSLDCRLLLLLLCFIIFLFFSIFFFDLDFIYFIYVWSSPGMRMPFLPNANFSTSYESHLGNISLIKPGWSKWLFTDTDNLVQPNLSPAWYTLTKHKKKIAKNEFVASHNQNIREREKKNQD